MPLPSQPVGLSCAATHGAGTRSNPTTSRPRNPAVTENPLRIDRSPCSVGVVWGTQLKLRTIPRSGVSINRSRPFVRQRRAEGTRETREPTDEGFGGPTPGARKLTFHHPARYAIR